MNSFAYQVIVEGGRVPPAPPDPEESARRQQEAHRFAQEHGLDEVEERNLVILTGMSPDQQDHYMDFAASRAEANKGGVEFVAQLTQSRDALRAWHLDRRDSRDRSSHVRRGPSRSPAGTRRASRRVASRDGPCRLGSDDDPDLADEPWRWRP
jgi:hypothetical protein